MPIEPGVAEAGDSGEPFVTKEGEAAQDRQVRASREP